MKADFGKGQKSLFKEIREVKEELITQKKKVIVLEDFVSFISDGYEKVKNENETMKTQIELVKADNIRLTETVAKVEESRDLYQKVNKMDNF